MDEQNDKTAEVVFNGRQVTPAMRQYMQAKAMHPEALLLFRMGDFYELFWEDARIASRVLELTLTTRDRDKNEDSIPMCGVPYHAVDSYISRLLAQGFKVAICDQMEDPKLAKGIVKREVTRVITPATASDSQAMASREANYLACSYADSEGFGLSVLDMLTGQFKVTRAMAVTTIADELGRLLPREILLPESLEKSFRQTLAGYDLNMAFTVRPDDYFKVTGGGGALPAPWPAYFAQTTVAAPLVWATLSYLQETLGQVPNHLNAPEEYELAEYMQLDETCRRNLELIRTSYDNALNGSLLWHLDHCRTPMGSRTLKQWLLYPLTSISAINQRLDYVEALYDEAAARQEVGRFLASVHDLERLNGKLAAKLATPRDLAALRDSIGNIAPLAAYIAGSELPEQIKRQVAELDTLADIHAVLDKSIRPEPLGIIGGGEIFQDGYNSELDECRQLQSHGREIILSLAEKERNQTGINTLKVKYNKVFGYYLEIPKAKADAVPAYYIRRQTTVNGERYITPELKELEDKILSAEERLATVETRLYQELINQLLPLTGRIRLTAAYLGRLDCYLSLAEIASEWGYCRPRLLTENRIAISGGRHPVIERLSRQLGERFIANDCHLDGDSQQLIIVTGPNMAGKSTMMRQVALITLMAHMGSFVPADKAEIGIRDRIFTRVGASDILHKGQSTFMVEMCETATILQAATPRSLIILDEIGRGTSTYDGLSIAWAIAEYLLDKCGSLTLFATHYHELTSLVAEYPKAKNYNVLVKELNDEIIFLRRLEPGAASRSYGIQVARLAGLPDTLVTRSLELLSKLEAEAQNLVPNLKPAEPLPAGPDPNQAELKLARRQLSFFEEPQTSKLEEALQKIDPDDISPRKALEILYKLKKMCN